MDDKAREFRKKFDGYNPNIIQNQLQDEQLQDFAKMIKGTPYENLIAFKDLKVKELLKYILVVIIDETQRLNSKSFTFPIEIHGREKSFYSTEDKIKDWTKRQEKTGKQISDYMGFKIVPTAEHSILVSMGDTELKKLIKKKETNREFIANLSHEIDSEDWTFTFDSYCNYCKTLLDKISKLFPSAAKKRIEYYKELIKIINKKQADYKKKYADTDKKYDLETCRRRLEYIDLEALIQEFKVKNNNETTLYVMKKSLMNVFNNSVLLKSLRGICF